MAENFVLIHGAWHGAFCWAAVINELGKHGDHTYAVDLPGNNGNPFERAKVTLQALRRQRREVHRGRGIFAT